MVGGDELKHRVSEGSVARLGRHLVTGDSSFPFDEFVRGACVGLAELELKARIAHVAEALAKTLPQPFPRACEVIQAANSLHSEIKAEDGAFVFWPLCTFVETHGLDFFDEAFATMHRLTGLASCEFALRPFVEREPQRSFDTLHGWTTDGDHHVRRLVSEGTRPRLPWGGRLRALQLDPSPTIALLDRLYCDDELYVRRSVANHLNDISKDHPDLAVEVAQGWMRAVEAGPRSEQVGWLARHALRGLVKQGHRGALALQGFARPQVEVTGFSVSPGRLQFGSELKIDLELKAGADEALMIDYAVHHRKSSGGVSAKVFKWSRVRAKSGENLVLEKRHSIRKISTRRYYDGPHKVEVLINGESVAIADFELVGVDSE